MALGSLPANLRRWCRSDGLARKLVTHGRRIRARGELQKVGTGWQSDAGCIGLAFLLVDIPQFLAKPVDFDADHRIVGGIKVFQLASEHLRRDVEFGRRVRFGIQVPGAKEFEQACVSSASAQNPDGSLQLLPFSVARRHI
jgi:hypothetical protein